MLHALTDTSSREIVVAQIKNLKSLVLLSTSLRAQLSGNLGQVTIGESRMSEEKDLQFFSVTDQLGERSDLILSWLPNLVLPRVDWARLEWLIIDWVPVNKQVLNWTVIRGQCCYQLADLSMRQSIIGESIVL